MPGPSTRLRDRPSTHRPIHRRPADGCATSASWKRFTALEINRQLSRRGMLWQVEQFDHLVRSLEQFDHLRTYIAENPKKARLKAGSYRWYSKDM
jgi:hypothetical protein